MNTIFEIASKISTPLGLAGFLCAVLFFLILQILKKRKKSSSEIKLIINRLFLLLLAAILLGFVAYVISNNKFILPPHTKTDSKELIRLCMLLPDMAFAKAVRDGFKDEFEKNFLQSEILEYYGPTNSKGKIDSDYYWEQKIKEVMRRHKLSPFHFFVTIGTQAAEKLKQNLGIDYGKQHFLFLAVTDPIRSGLVSSLQARYDSLKVSGVTYGSGIEEVISIINGIFPEKQIFFIFDPNPDFYNQDIYMADRLKKTDFYCKKKVKIIEVTNFPTLENFKDKYAVYFSWYILETMFDSGAGMDLLENRIIVASTEANVSPSGLAFIGVAPDDREIGYLGAKIIERNKLDGEQFETMNIIIPQYYYWINTETANKRGIEFPPLVLKKARKLYCN